MSQERQPRQAADLIRQMNQDTVSDNYATPDTYHDLAGIEDLVIGAAQLLDIIGRATAHKAEQGLLRHDNDSRLISDDERQAHTVASAEIIGRALKDASAALWEANRNLQAAHNELSHLADLDPS